MLLLRRVQIRRSCSVSTASRFACRSLGTGGSDRIISSARFPFTIERRRISSGPRAEMCFGQSIEQATCHGAFDDFERFSIIIGDRVFRVASREHLDQRGIGRLRHGQIAGIPQECRPMN